MKHVHWLTHWYLGFCLGLAPVGVTVALGVPVTSGVIAIACGVMFWTAGFDLLYSLQDVEFDRQQRLHSIPARMGVRGAIWGSRISFGIAATSWAAAGVAFGASWIYFAGIIGIVLCFVVEHWMIRDVDDRGRSRNISAAFFNVNAGVSLIFLATVICDRWFGGF